MKSHPVPKVSFMALCFNHAPYVLECLASIEAQAWPNAELVILDNASTDGSADLIRQWAADSTLEPKLLLQSEPLGICANINTLIEHAAGDYLAWLATDDYWLPEKTATQVAALERLGPEFAVAYADALRVDPAGEPLDPASFIRSHREFETPPSGDILLDLLRGPFIPGMSTMVRSSALGAMGPFDESLIYEDYDAWLRLAEKWQFHADPNPNCAYRILASSMIRTVAAEDKPEKILSDARIMAKVTNMQRLDETTRKNSKRRVLKLTIRLLDHPGDWHGGLLELQQVTGLQALFLLAAAHRDRGQLPSDVSHRLLASAADRGFLPAGELKSFPKPASKLLQATKGPRFSNVPSDPDRWVEIYQELKVNRKPWWKFGGR